MCSQRPYDNVLWQKKDIDEFCEAAPTVFEQLQEKHYCLESWLNIALGDLDHH